MPPPYICTLTHTHTHACMHMLTLMPVLDAHKTEPIISVSTHHWYYLSPPRVVFIGSFAWMCHLWNSPNCIRGQGK